MFIQLFIIKNGQIWDYSNNISDITINNTMYDQPGKLEFTINNTADIPMGSLVQLHIDYKNIFKGYVFETTLSESNQILITAYDQMRYLKNEDTLFIENQTASQAFEEICKRMNLQYKIINPSSFKTLPYLHEKKSMFAIIKHMIDETFFNTGKMYMVRDNFGMLEFIDIIEQKTNLIIGYKSIMTGYNYVQSIDKDTYNRIKLIRDNEKTKKRDVWIVEDSNTQKKWGILQFHESVDEDATEAQIKELARNILTVKNRITRDLSIRAIGFYNLRAGDGIKIEIPEVIDDWFYLSSVTTTISENYAEMEMEIFIP